MLFIIFADSFMDRDEKRRSATLDSRAARRDQDDHLHDQFNGSDVSYSSICVKLGENAFAK